MSSTSFVRGCALVHGSPVDVGLSAAGMYSQQLRVSRWQAFAALLLACRSLGSRDVMTTGPWPYVTINLNCLLGQFACVDLRGLAGVVVVWSQMQTKQLVTCKF